MDKAAALREEAITLHRAGRLPEAEALYRQSLNHNPRDARARHMLGTLRLQQGRADEALALLAEARSLAPGNAELIAHHGLALHVLGRFAEALADFDRALVLAPDHASAHSYRGNTLRALDRPAEALDAYDRLLALAPDYAEGWYTRGLALWSLGREAEALAAYDRAVSLNPAHAEAWYNRGVLLGRMKRPAEAAASYDRAVRAKPDFWAAWNNLGGALQELRRHDDARKIYAHVISLNPEDPDAWNNHGVALHRLNLPAEAVRSFDQALTLRPDYADAWSNRGFALCDLKYLDDSLESFARALALDPGHAESWHNRGKPLLLQKRFAEALGSYEKALALKPDHRYALGGAADAVLNLCDWPRTARIARAVENAVAQASAVIPPFAFLNHCGDAGLQRACAEIYVADHLPPMPPPLWTGTPHVHDRIRLAYVSADYHAHATAHLMAGLFERHDRGRFEVTAISLGPDDGGPMRKRLVAAFDRFIDGRGKTDLEVARLLRAAETDIAIDLKGHTQDARLGIFAHRPAPVQATWIGYPGTTGAPFIDYVIADPIVLPFADQRYFSETIVHMPHSYQVNDSRRAIAPIVPTRRQTGLPETGFVFCCFNNNWKISPAMFDVWMRLLAGVPGSVLWLLEDNEAAKRNLWLQARQRGVDPARLVFGPRIELADHLSRHALADLFLDTLPCNAHTTASDALWAGLPIVTCRGESFPGRVAASLLTAVGLPELVTSSLEDYEALAFALARDPARLAALRRKLADNRLTAPLFDTERFARDVETAFTRMVTTALAGGPPQSFAVVQP